MEPADEWSVLLGVHSQDGPLDGAHLRSVAAILVPHNYSRVELGADLALLRLASPARLSPSVRPVCLPRASHRFAHGTACWATGWGDVQEAGKWGERPPLQVWVSGHPESWVLRWVASQKLGLNRRTQAELGRLSSDPRKIPNLPLCTFLCPRGYPTSGLTFSPSFCSCSLLDLGRTRVPPQLFQTKNYPCTLPPAKGEKQPQGVLGGSDGHSRT